LRKKNVALYQGAMLTASLAVCTTSTPRNTQAWYQGTASAVPQAA
jgi:hypothetical protein